MDLIIFLVLAGLMLVIGLTFLLPSLLRRQSGDETDRQQQNIRIAREQLAALTREHADGLLTDQELAQDRADLEQALMQDLNAEEESPSARSGGRWVALPVLLFVPVLTVMLYFGLGNLPSLAPEAAAPAQAQMQDLSPEDISQMVGELAQRLQQEPDDLQGWFMLGRSYMVLQRYNEAAEAFRELYQRVGDEPRVIMLYADALAMAQEGRITGRPLELLDLVLNLEPRHITARWMKGIALRQQGLTDQALAIWNELLNEEGLDPQVRQQLQEMIQQSGGVVAGSEVTDTGADSPSASIQVAVSIDPALAAGLPGDTPVFVLARAANGPRAPLAVSRHRLDELPLEVELNDSMAMMEALKLSAFAEVTVIARASASGEPIAQPGDLQGQADNIAPGKAEPVKIVIDSVIE